jgi:hypothetical protein
VLREGWPRVGKIITAGGSSGSGGLGTWYVKYMS